MSPLSAAEARASGVLERLERALQAGGVRRTSEGDGDNLRRECEALRRDLAAANQRSERFAAIVAQLEGRIDGAIDRVDEITGAGAAP